MRYEVRLIPNLRTDSEREIKRELNVLDDILGCEGSAGHAEDGAKCVVYKGDFWELYKKIKDRIYRRLEAQE